MHMSNKQDILNMLPRLYRKDKWLNDLFNAVGLSTDRLEQDTENALNELFGDTATYALPMYETELGLNGEGKTLEDRRAAVVAGWQRGGKVDIHQIQAAANAWRNGETVVDFKDGKIIVTFVGAFGVPDDMQGLMNAINIIKPAHLIVEYVFRYLLIKDIHEVMTIADMDDTKLSLFGH